MVHAKKRFGQNFLIDEDISERIVESACLTAEDTVLEIGPGTGTLTKLLAARAGRVLAVEIDESLGKTLEETLGGMEHVSVLYQDILKCDLDALRADYNDGRAFKVVANLPYYISTPVIMKLLQDTVPPLSCTVMVQKEMGERMCASPGGKEYGALSVAVQYYAKPELICEVPPHAFRPQPKVTSAVIRLVPLETSPVSVKDRDFFFRVTEGAFAHRRKTLVNSLSADASLGLSKERIAEALRALAADGLLPRGGKEAPPENIRAERLSIEAFAALADRLGE